MRLQKTWSWPDLKRKSDYNIFFPLLLIDIVLHTLCIFWHLDNGGSFIHVQRTVWSRRFWSWDPRFLHSILSCLNVKIFARICMISLSHLDILDRKFLKFLNILIRIKKIRWVEKLEILKCVTYVYLGRNSCCKHTGGWDFRLFLFFWGFWNGRPEWNIWVKAWWKNLANCAINIVGPIQLIWVEVPQKSLFFQLSGSNPEDLQNSTSVFKVFMKILMDCKDFNDVIYSSLISTEQFIIYLQFFRSVTENKSIVCQPNTDISLKALKECMQNFLILLKKSQNSILT